ncbi:unnamed protein product, partial [Rotaria sordida]
QIELSYNELQEKYHIAEQLEEQLKQLIKNLNEKDFELKQQNDLFEKLKIDYEHQHFYLIERDENIRILKIELEQYEKFKENLIENYQNQINQLENNLEQQKLLLLNTTENQDEIFSLKLKQENELNDLIEIKINENKQLIEINQQLNNDLKEKYELILEKNQQIDHYQKQLNLLNIEYEEIQIQFYNIKEEKEKLINEINLLMNKIINLEKEKFEFIQNIDDLKQQLETNNNLIDQDKIQLQQTIENLKHELELNIIPMQDIQLKQSCDNNEQQQTILLNHHHQSELEIISKDNEIHNQIINDSNDKMKKQISDSNENIQELKEKYQKMKILLTRLKKELQEKAQQHQPKQSLIDLELADYDKIIKNLKDDLINKDKEIQDLNDELSNWTDKYTCLKLENNNLEQQNIQIEERANKFKALLDNVKKELHHAKELELQRHYNDDHTSVLIEKLQNDLDQNKTLINDLQNEKQQLIEKLNDHNETTQRTINLLEQNLHIAKHDLDITKQDNDTLQDDFNNYKIRAQSVLKQQQLNQRDRTPSLADKQIELEETIEKLNITLRETNNKIQLLISENETFQKEQDRLIELQAKLMNESKKREQDLRKQHKIEIDNIENEYLQRINDNDDKLKNAILHNDTLSTAFKEQISTMESDHKHTISISQNDLEISRQEIQQLKIHIELLQQTNIDNKENSTSNPESSHIGINNHCNRDDTLACSTDERQQGEKPESTNINHQSSNITMKISDNVLHDINSSSTIENNTTTNTQSSLNDKSRDNIYEYIQLERQHSEDELNKTKLILFDTKELLQESELNNIRLNEQIKLLKDEIRRLERNMDRAESISNLEYLKNIILKFFILKSTHERLQLIPVLVTMLKLSPDEQAQLVRVANLSTTITIDENSTNNESLNRHMTNDVNSSSWSSYLNIW